MIGFTINDNEGIGIMSFPNRKAKALYAKRGCEIWPLAYFRSEETAREAEQLLNLLAQGIVMPE